MLSYSTTTGQLTGINDENNGVSLDNLTFTYDPLGRVSTFSSIDGTATYGYDHTSQLVSASYTTASGGHQPANVSFTWDANGNNAATGNVVSANNEVTNDGTFTYTFDANGNRTSRTRISNNYASDYKTTYTWDYRNRLTDVETYDNNPGAPGLTKQVHYVYDVLNNLIEEDIDPTGGGSYTTTKQFALDVQPKLPVQVLSLSGTIDPSAPPDTLLEFVNGALAERFLSAPSPSGADVIYAEGNVDSLTQPDVTDWIFVNNQGSPTDVVNSSGTLIDHNVYSPFGQVVYVSNTGVFVFQGFSGGIPDPNTGLIKDGERWYDPLATVWTSLDPAGFEAGDTNPDRYVFNSPTNAEAAQGLWSGAQYPIGGFKPGATGSPSPSKPVKPTRPVIGPGSPFNEPIPGLPPYNPGPNQPGNGGQGTPGSTPPGWPFKPGSPFAPGAPSGPGSPFGPSAPFAPGSPFGPGLPSGPIFTPTPPNVIFGNPPGVSPPPQPYQGGDGGSGLPGSVMPNSPNNPPIVQPGTIGGVDPNNPPKYPPLLPQPGAETPEIGDFGPSPVPGNYGGDVTIGFPGFIGPAAGGGAGPATDKPGNTEWGIWGGFQIKPGAPKGGWWPGKSLGLPCPTWWIK